MAKLISNPFTAAVADSITAATNNSIAALKPFHSPLTEKQKIGIRTMAEGREGMVRLMSKIATQHINSLPREEDPEEMKTLLIAYEEGSKTVQAIMELYEMINDTQTSVGIDLMKLYDRYNGHLQTARSGNNALDEAMKGIDEYNARFGKSTPDEEADPEGPTPPTE